MTNVHMRQVTEGRCRPSKVEYAHVAVDVPGGRWSTGEFQLGQGACGQCSDFALGQPLAAADVVGEINPRRGCKALTDRAYVVIDVDELAPVAILFE